MTSRPFSPLGASVSVAAGNSASSASNTLPGVGGASCRVYNSGTVPAVVAFAQIPGGAVATANSSVEIAGGLTDVISMPIGTTDVAAYGIGGTPSVIFQRGDGL